MTGKTRTTDNTRHERVRLRDRADGTYEAVYVQNTYRFLLDDGRTVDVIAHYDSSDLRALVVEATGASIVGLATLPGPSVEPPDG